MHHDAEFGPRSLVLLRLWDVDCLRKCFNPHPGGIYKELSPLWLFKLKLCTRTCFLKAKPINTRKLLANAAAGRQGLAVRTQYVGRKRLSRWVSAVCSSNRDIPVWF